MILFSQFVVPIGRDRRYDVIDLIRDLASGDPMGWIAIGGIGGLIAFFALYQKFTGRSFVKSRKERREARRRRKHVIWEYRRDKN